MGAPRSGADPAGPENTRSYPAPAAELPRGEPPATGLPYTPKFATGRYLKSTKRCLGTGPAPAQNQWTPLPRARSLVQGAHDLSLRSSCGWALQSAQPLLGSRRSQKRKTASLQGKEGFPCRPVSARSPGSRHGAPVPVHRENTLLGLFAKCTFWTKVRKSLSE